MNRLTYLFIILAFVLTLCNCKTTTPRISTDPVTIVNLMSAKEKLDYFLEIADSLRIMSNVPGVGLSIIYNDSILFEGGLGFADIKNRKPVLKKSLFSIGSNTKGITGIIATKIVSQGLIEWNTPLKKLIPELKLKERYIEENLTLSDALSHATGLKSDDSIWKYKTLSRDSLLKSLISLDFVSSFRSSYDYNNMMFAVAGIALERASGKTWENLVQELVFKPLEMTSSYASHEEFISSKNRAIGYRPDGISPDRIVDLTSIAPSGAVSSTPSDMSKLLQMLVNEGISRGKTYLDSKSYNYLMSPHTRLSIRNEDELWYYYAGLGGFSKNGKRTLGHSGSIDGYNSRVIIKPDDNFAIMVMTNSISSYKDLLTEYAEQIFLTGKLERNYQHEFGLESIKHSYLIENLLIREGEDKANMYYQTISRRKLGEHLEANFNSLGYYFLSREDFKNAIFVFKLNTDDNPYSANAFDSLAEAYYNSKQYKLSLVNYEKSLSLDYENNNAKNKIEEIKKIISTNSKR